jgi:hypothetical protein
MDAYLAPLMNTSPRQLLNKHQAIISKFISPHFRCNERVTNIALSRLALGDGFLRLIKLPHIIYKVARLVDKRISKNFIYYVAKTQIAIVDIAEVLNGNKPLFEPEQKNISVEQLDQWRTECLNHLNLMHPRPIQYFAE